MSLSVKAPRSEKLVKSRTERFRAPESFLELIEEHLKTRRVFAQLKTKRVLSQDRSKLYRKLILEGLLHTCSPSLVERVKQEQEKNGY